MSVDRAQIEHLRSFVATPRCMSYETIRSLDDILDNLEAASAEVAALRRQLEERKSPDVVTVPRGELDRIADSIEEGVNAIREDWTDPRTNLKYIRGEIEAIRALRSGDAGKDAT